MKPMMNLFIFFVMLNEGKGTKEKGNCAEKSTLILDSREKKAVSIFFFEKMEYLAAYIDY